MSSTTIELLTFCKDAFGGSISTQKTYKEHYKKSYSWKLTGNKALAMCAIIYPHIKEPEKKRRINHLLQFYKKVTSPNGHYTQEMLDIKIKFEVDFFYPSVVDHSYYVKPTNKSLSVG